MDFKGKGVLEEGSSSQVNNYEAKMLQEATDSLVDLTLRLGISPASDEQSRPAPNHSICQTFPQRPFPNPAIGSTSMGNFPQANINPLAAYQINSASGSSFKVNAAATIPKKYNFPAPPQVNKYCLINISTKKGKTGGSRKRKATARPPARGDEKRTCTNYNCRTTKAPMWRRGPLGAKTLCNRCGIRYRKLKIKQQEKEKKAEEAAAKKRSGAAANAK